MRECQFALGPSTSQLRFTLRNARSTPKVMVKAKPTASTMSGTRVRSFGKIVSSFGGIGNLLVKLTSSFVKLVNPFVKLVNPVVKAVNGLVKVLNPLVRIVATTVGRRSQGQAAGRTSLFNFWADVVLLSCTSDRHLRRCCQPLQRRGAGCMREGGTVPVRGS